MRLPNFMSQAFPNFVPIILDLWADAVTYVDFKKATWKAGVEFDVGPRSLLYANVATGFKSDILYSALGQNFSAPERLTAYTLGSKNRFFDNPLQSLAKSGVIYNQLRPPRTYGVLGSVRF